MKQKVWSIGMKASAIMLMYLYIWYSMMGFRWPSLYVMSNHIVTSKFGFMPRTLISSIVEIFCADYLYKRKFLYILILSVSFVFILYILCNMVTQVAIKQSMLYFFVFLSFVLSPYAKYYIHEAGYFEQYGYLLGIILLTIVKKKGRKTICWLSAVFSFISVMISETNLFLIVPFMFSIALLEILGEDYGRHIFQKFTGLFAMYIPTVAYSLLVYKIKVPKRLVEQIQEYDLSRADFYISDIYKYFWNDRSNKDIWGRTLHEIPVECIILPLILVCVIAFLVSKINKKIAVTYFVLSVLCGLFNYSIVILAWDLSRYYFCIYMQTLFLTFYILKKYLSDYRLNKNENMYFVIYILAIIGMSRFELSLFDGAEYSRTSTLGNS